jgi:hypothetical protein
MSTARPSRWEQKVAADPSHSTWYVERFRSMAADGADLAGEARLVDAMLPRGSRVLGDLAELDLPAEGVADPFDAIVCAGNVMTFLAPGTEVEVLRRFGTHLAPGGRVVVGFGAGRGYPHDAFLADVATAGLRVDLALATWDLRPWSPDADFLVAVLSAS